MWWQASLIVLALVQAEPQRLSPEGESDLFALMERLQTERLRRLNQLVRELKQNARLPQDFEDLKAYRSEQRRLSQKDEPYFPEIVTPVKVGDLGYVHYPYEVLSIAGPRDVVVYKPDLKQRDDIAWITDFDTSELIDGKVLPLSDTGFYSTETRSYNQVGGGRRTVPVMRPMSQDQLKRIWTEHRKSGKKKKKN